MDSAWTRTNGLPVKMTWWRQRPNSSACPAGTLLAFSRFTRRTISRAVAWNRFFLLVNAVNGTSSISASETQRSFSGSQTAAAYLIGVQASSAMRAIASRIVFVTATAREEAAAARQTATALWEKNAESARTTKWPAR